MPLSHHPKLLSSPEVSSLLMEAATAEQEEEERITNNNTHHHHLHRVVEEKEEEEEEEEELELGLSLGARVGAKVGKGGSSSSSSFPRGGQWGEYCRILTARDLASPINTSKSNNDNVGANRRVSPMSSSSSVSSSSSSMGGGFASKRAAGDPVPQSQMVGWPPIRASRINSLFNHHTKDGSPSESTDDQHKKPVGIGNDVNDVNDVRSIEVAVNGTQDRNKKKPKTFHVKVNMDGMPIGRKVDLNAHRSYKSLAFQLEDMFQNNPKPTTNELQIMKTSKLLDGSSEFVLTYEDRDGDWMLVGDVPWQMFLSTVRRLRIMRTVDANGLAPRIRSQGV